MAWITSSARNDSPCTESQVSEKVTQMLQCRLLFNRQNHSGKAAAARIPLSKAEERIALQGGVLSHMWFAGFHASNPSCQKKTAHKQEAKRVGKRAKWAELHTRGGTVFRAGEHSLKLPTAERICEETDFASIFNAGFDGKGHPLPCPPGEGGRWHGRKAVGGGEAAWVGAVEDGANDGSVPAWLGADGLNWLATATGAEAKVVADTHALRAGVDGSGNVATTPEQSPLHADSCWPNSHAAARAPWGDAHLVLIIARHDRTRLPIYPFDKGGEREVVELNAGDVLIFRGDLIHCGADYAGLNIRIHSYIDSPAAPQRRDPDETYIVQPDSWGHCAPVDVCAHAESTHRARVAP